MCALRKQRSVETAIMTKKFSGLVRTHSQPSNSSRFAKLNIHGHGTTNSSLPKAVLSPLTDEVFVEGESNETVAAEDLCETSTELDENGLPKRKIRNLREFLDLGRTSKSSSCDGSNPCSPAKSSTCNPVNTSKIDELSRKEIGNSISCKLEGTESSMNHTKKYPYNYNRHSMDYDRYPLEEVHSSFCSKDSRNTSSSTISSVLRPQSQVSSDDTPPQDIQPFDARRCFSESDAVYMAEHPFNSTTSQDDNSQLCVEVWENPVASSPLDETGVDAALFDDSSATGNNHKDGTLSQCTGWIVGMESGQATGSKLPTPDKFGGGNPFLMIVCVSILLHHRKFIMTQRLDHNDLAMPL